MTDFVPQSLSDMVAGELRGEIAAVSRNLAAVVADPQTREASQRPATMGRRLGTVTAVNNIFSFPLSADVMLNDTTIPGCSPQSTYRPQVGDLVWLEFLGPDAHISAPLTTDANRKWNNLTLSGAWTLSGTTPAYWRDPLGMVHLRGAMQAGANGVFATMPAGFRPPHDKVFSVPTSDGVSWVFSAVVARAAGNLEYIGPAAPVAAYVDGITFRID